jgi:hypothetical protein
VYENLEESLVYKTFKKTLVDSIHASWSKSEKLSVDNYTKSLHATHIYENITIFEKRNVKKNENLIFGLKTLK